MEIKKYHTQNNKERRGKDYRSKGGGGGEEEMKATFEAEKKRVHHLSVLLPLSYANANAFTVAKHKTKRKPSDVTPFPQWERVKRRRYS